MARFFDVHPVTPQQRLINQVVQMLQQDGLIAYPTDSGYALGCRLGNVSGVERIREIRHLDDRHDFTLVCHDFAQMSQFVFVSNKVFRLIKAHTPGSYTFILPATREVPRRFMNPKKRTVGVRISPNPVALSLVETLGEPLLSSTLLMPGEDQAMSDGWEVKERLDHLVDAVIDGEAGTEPTTVVDLSEGDPVIRRVGAGDPAPFEEV
ncbi:MAG: L-threonylcarbamoyladenylate synthase [Candidatus Nanopelagicales bacterium]|jgi:tRNA threonylcarbamoyl adenosine modification protein (Sua5/YciO/YrdC/YwlC family)|nr:threonylcarbamoyl-AMP synthase [Actinomycetota bacterium]HNE88080.1 L-threonylcarbamoyladenylate synthase [Actinomycetota bacterium]HNL50914.1 L-threonylcarbamoyladenylate synthase [Actinomycetota bacterium]HNO14776.1 L-threonylcarbamoyladenylate synthase [Actinomycetota bacterium]HUM86018.1 L-threonylcarbamoyladenylate synthase [Actinomycetota bacterium]